MVVMPSMVKETSLTTVLLEPPPPEPELPPADCEDEVSDVSDVADVDDVAEVADVDDAAEDDVADVDWDVEAATADEAIALIDMKTPLEGKPRRSPVARPTRSFNAVGAPSRRRSCEKLSLRRVFLQQSPATNRRAASCSFFPSVRRPRERLQPAPASREWTVTSSHDRVSWSAAGEFSRASRDQ